MCGIIGIISPENNAVKEVYEGLERLEYRGYDSAGLAVLDGGEITVVKRAGRVNALKEEIKGLYGGIAIGHTRWATHGQPTDANAHPHASGKFALVHNGIIENWRELKEELSADGAAFLSQTDSEVIVKLIEKYYDGDLLKAVTSAALRLKGSYALAVTCRDFAGIVGVKFKSPAVVGFGVGLITVCSDVPALPQSVKNICVPEDGDAFVLTADGVEFYSNLQPVKRVSSPILQGQFGAGKGNYPHYMIKEIRESGRTVTQTVENFLRYADRERLKQLVLGADRIIITGCGTAYNAGLVAKKFFEKNGIFCQVEIASELRYSGQRVTDKTLVLAVSQSGETADTVEAVAALKAAGATVVAVTNCGYSAITRVAHSVVPVCAGAEICVAATKSYLGQLAALYLIANLAQDASAAGEKLIEACAQMPAVIENGERADTIARLCAQSSAVFFLGRGTDYAVAVEASLKLKEITYIFSDGYPAGELKHGTLALIDGGTLSVFVVCDESLAEKSMSAVSQIKSRGGKVAVITCLDGVERECSDDVAVWRIPDCAAEISPFLSAIALQLIAYHTAVILKRDPDKPRNLAKSVTVE